MQKFKKKLLVSALSLVALSTVSTTSHTSDVEIYKQATQGAPSILLMLDTSGSMGISSLVLPKDNQYGSPGDVTSSICKQEMVLEDVTSSNAMEMPQWQYDAVDYRTNVTVKGVPNQRSPTYGKTSFYHEVKIGEQYIPYYMRGCTIDDTKVAVGQHNAENIQFDRLSKLKDAILTLLASQELDNSTKIGLANFSARTDVKIFDFGLSLVDGHSGAILVPVAALDTAQRAKLASTLAEFVSLDTTTNEKGDRVTVRVGDAHDSVEISQLSLTNRTFTPDVLNYKRVSSGTPTAHAYAEAAAYMMGTGTGKRNNWVVWREPTEWVASSGTITAYREREKTIPYVYDGYAIMRHNAAGVSENELQGYQDKTVYFLCLQAERNADGTLKNGDTWAWGHPYKYRGVITQCMNSWQGEKARSEGHAEDRVREVVSSRPSINVRILDTNKMREVVNGTRLFTTDLRYAEAFYGYGRNGLKISQETIQPYSGDGAANVRTSYFVRTNNRANQLIGEVKQTTINGRTYEYFLEFRKDRTAQPVYAKVTIAGQYTYDVMQVNNEWSGLRDDDFLLYEEGTINRRAHFEDGFRGYGNNRVQGMETNKRYQFIGLRIQKADGQTEIFYGKNSSENITYANIADAKWQAWKAMVDMPEGSRLIDSQGDGGWTRLAHEPMDIEPIVGGNHANSETGAIGLFVYRANPFSLAGGDGGTGLVSTLTADDMVGGMAYSASDTKLNDTTYNRGGSTGECDGNGIYFLTDGAPNSTQDLMARTIMNHSLTTPYEINNKPTGGLVSPQLKSNMFAGETGGWEYIGEYAKRIRDPSTNPARMSIKTAVVGFGSSFESAKGGNCDAVSNLDAKNACKWGSSEYGDGGFYYANDANDIKSSIINFVSKVSTTIDPTPVGSPSIPTNSFNPLEAPKDAYYGSFTPKPASSARIWLGNMNKYTIENSELVGEASSEAQLIGQNNRRLFNSDGKLNQQAVGLWGAGGALGKLALGANPTDANKFARQVFTDKSVSNGNALKKVTTTTSSTDNTISVFDNALGNTNYWLNLLGYDVELTQSITSLDALNQLNAPTLRQLGAVMHSTPILLTQEGALRAVNEVDKDGKPTGKRVIESTGRKDYLLYGSTQGALHIVDTNGNEKFAFVPDEMLTLQKDALLNESKVTSGGITKLFYGIDAPWVAYTQYTLKTENDEGETGSTGTGNTNTSGTGSTGTGNTNTSGTGSTGTGNTNTSGTGNTGTGNTNTSGTQPADAAKSRSAETLTVNSRTYRYNPNTPSSLDSAALQWVYGGLRMGGRSYYALDLSDINNPKLRFSIKPGEAAAGTPLSYMGQSWSKPTIARVKWTENGKQVPKLVMFVGGGYDAGGTDGDGTFDDQGNRTGYEGYEQPNYNQTNKRGAGVYMFDAANGELLWWGGANVETTTPAAENPDIAATKNDAMEYSVVSQINAVDRNNDGFVDHLYFGDLGGQGFRIDIDNKATTRGAFVKRIERLFNEHKTDGSSPRFYEMPVMSSYLHEGHRRAIVAFNSGNISSPLAGEDEQDSTKTTVSAIDATYVVYDYNVTKTDLYTDNNLASYDGKSWADFDQVNGTAFNTETTRGWKYTYGSVAGQFKGRGAPTTLGNFLYVSVYNKDDSVTEVNTCNAGVVGSTQPHRLCLPTGQCDNARHGLTMLNNTTVKGEKLAGFSNISFGGGVTNANNVVGVVGGGETPDNCETNPAQIGCGTQKLDGSISQLRWYEAN